MTSTAPWTLRVAAGILVGAAALVSTPRSASPWRRTAAGLRPQASGRSRRPRIAPGATLVALAATAGWLGVVAGPPLVGRPALAPLPAAAGVTVAVSMFVRTRTQRRHAATEQLAVAVAEAVAVLAADLSVGRSPPQALAALADEAEHDPDPTRVGLGRLLRPVAETCRLGGSVPESLRSASLTEGCAALGRVAAAWQLAESTGAPVVSVLGRVAAAVRLHADHVRNVRVELAGPRASARLLAALPVIGLLMGTGLGAQPLQVLLTTTYGQVALCVGVALELAGLAWTDRIARRAEAR